MQVLVGLPLEMVHGSMRIGAVYMAGVLAGKFFFFVPTKKKRMIFNWTISLSRVTGSLGTSVFDTDVYLVGASGGVYALLAAHLANVLLVSFARRHNVLLFTFFYRFSFFFAELQQYGIWNRSINWNFHRS